MLQGTLFVSGSGLKVGKPLAGGRIPDGPPSIGHEFLLHSHSPGRSKGLSSVDGEVEVHRLSGTGEVIGGLLFQVPLSNVPCCGSGKSQDLLIDWGKFRPLEVRAIHIEGVFLPSVLKSEEFSGGSLILFGIDVVGDVGENSDLFGDVGIGEVIGFVV